MEEIIKILTESILQNKYHIYQKTLKRYIRNLIKGYRELEEENKLLKKVDNIVENIDTEKVILKIEDDDSIQKSKIKEIIEELDSKSKYCAISDLTEYMYKKEVLLELLEG